MIITVIVLTIALIAVNAVLAVAVRVIRSSHTRYIKNTEIAARLARAQALDEIIKTHIPLAKKY